MRGGRGIEQNNPAHHFRNLGGNEKSINASSRMTHEHNRLLYLVLNKSNDVGRKIHGAIFAWHAARLPMPTHITGVDMPVLHQRLEQWLKIIPPQSCTMQKDQQCTRLWTFGIVH